MMLSNAEVLLIGYMLVKLFCLTSSFGKNDIVLADTVAPEVKTLSIL